MNLFDIDVFLDNEFASRLSLTQLSLSYVISIWDACAAADDEVAGGCPCRKDDHCSSGDCNTMVTSLDWVCEFATSAGEHASFGKFLGVAAMLGALFLWM
jgi:hypothetical protein